MFDPLSAGSIFSSSESCYDPAPIFLLIGLPLPNPSFVLLIEFLTELFLFATDLLDIVAIYSCFFLFIISLIALKSASAYYLASVY